MTTISNDLAAKLVLTPMAPERDAEFGEMLDEFRAAGETHVYEGDFAVAWRGYGPFYDLISKMKAGGYPKPEIVPMDSYFIEIEGRIFGEIFIRHRLSAALEHYGGHIGYKVRPSCRNRGVATAALRLALQKLAAIGVPRALVTCSAANLASARVIKKRGAMRIEDSHQQGRVTRRYWLATT
ncbi:MAG: GNAT family N-acetyltransferase [Bryobacteraceae bacterium]